MLAGYTVYCLALSSQCSLSNRNYMISLRHSPALKIVLGMRHDAREFLAIDYGTCPGCKEQILIIISLQSYKFAKKKSINKKSIKATWNELEMAKHQCSTKLIVTVNTDNKILYTFMPHCSATSALHGRSQGGMIT